MGAVEGDGRLVVRGDARLGHPHALRAHEVLEGLEQHRAEVPPLMGRGQVDGGLGHPVVGGAGAERAVVGVAGDLARGLVDGDEVGAALGRALDTAAELFDGGDLDLEADDGAGHVRGVDGEDTGCVVGDGGADSIGHGLSR